MPTPFQLFQQTDIYKKLHAIMTDEMQPTEVRREAFRQMRQAMKLHVEELINKPQRQKVNEMRTRGEL